jgi:two-component sensor histidine kinase
MKVRHERGGHLSPALKGSIRLTLAYLIVGAAWIALSDRTLSVLIRDPLLYAELQTIKGWFYVAATSALFGFFAFKELQRIAILQERELQSRREFEASMTAALREKEELLRELNHRVKNNLQLISSLLSLRMDRIVDPTSRVFFVEFLSRIKSMALVHDSLFATDAFAEVDMRSLILEATAEYAAAFGSLGVQFFCTTEAGLQVEMEKAVPIALIVNEAVLNAIGHAFPDGKGGTVTLSAKSGGEAIDLEVRDDGVGFDPSSVDGPSVGLDIIRSLAKQIDAQIELISSTSGTMLKLRVARYQAAPKIPLLSS